MPKKYADHPTQGVACFFVCKLHADCVIFIINNYEIQKRSPVKRVVLAVNLEDFAVKQG